MYLHFLDFSFFCQKCEEWRMCQTIVYFNRFLSHVFSKDKMALRFFLFALFSVSHLDFVVDTIGQSILYSHGLQDGSTIFYCLFLMPKLRSFTFRTLASIFRKKLPRKLTSYQGQLCSIAPISAYCDPPRLWHTYRGQICLDFRKLL